MGDQALISFGIMVFVSKSLLTSVIYFKTNEINYLSDHAQIEIFLKCNISEKQSLFPEDKWKTMKSYKWNDNSKNILIQTLSSENFINEIINFESKKYSENQNGIDQAASELDLILCNLTEKTCTLRHVRGIPNFKRNKKKRNKNGQIMKYMNIKSQ